MNEALRRHEPIHPGEILSEFHMKKHKLSVSALARNLEVSRKHLSKLVNCQVNLTPAMAVRLGACFNTTSAEFWMNLQSRLDIYRARKKLNFWT